MLTAKLKRQFGFEGRKSLLRRTKCKCVKDLIADCTEEAKTFLQRHIECTPEQRARIANHGQGGGDWLKSRQYRITGSRFAGAIGHNSYESPRKTAEEIICSTFTGNAVTRRGNKLEPDACRWIETQQRKLVEDELKLARVEGRSFIRYAHREYPIPANLSPQTKIFEIRHQGLVVSPLQPWIAASSDGDIYLFGVMIGQIEIKCPGRNQFYPLTPIYYFDQIQGNLHLSPTADFCLVVVFTTRNGIDAVKVEHIEYDREYCETVLFPALNEFWFTEVLPRALVFEKEKAKQKSITPPLDTTTAQGFNELTFRKKRKPSTTTTNKSTTSNSRQKQLKLVVLTQPGTCQPGTGG